MSSAPVCSFNSASDPPNRLTTQSSQQELDFAFLPPPPRCSLYSPYPACPSSCLLSPPQPRPVLPSLLSIWLRQPHPLKQPGMEPMPSRIGSRESTTGPPRMVPMYYGWLAWLEHMGFPVVCLSRPNPCHCFSSSLFSLGSREGPALAPCAPPSFPHPAPCPQLLAYTCSLRDIPIHLSSRPGPGHLLRGGCPHLLFLFSSLFMT